MRTSLRRLGALPPHDWWLLAQAWFLLLATDLGLRALSFGRVCSILTRTPAHAAKEPLGDEMATISHLKRLVDVAGSHHVYPMNCLERALVLSWLLGRRGIATELQIGVRKDTGREELLAHAWLEYRGQRIGEEQPGADQFAPLTAVDAGP